VQFIVLAAVSFAVATLGSLIGAGGGFLLMPILLFLYQGVEYGGRVLGPAELTFISLVAVLVNGVAATVNYARMKRIDYRTGIILGLCAAPMAILARLLLKGVRQEQFGAVFGGVLVAIGVFVIWRTPRGADASGRTVAARPHWSRRRIVDGSGLSFEYAFNLRLGMTASLAGGFIGSFFGIGGGILHVPVMTQLLHFPAHVATATSIMILSASAATGVLTDVVSKGTDVPTALALAAGVGAFLGAQAGTRLSRRVTGKGILYLLAAVLILCGGKLLFGPVLSAKEGPGDRTERTERRHDELRMTNDERRIDDE